MAYFTRVGPAEFRATDHVGGAWRAGEQHIAPALGLLAHAVELDRDARRDDGMVVGRLSYDILGTIPVDTVQTTVRVLRPGRTIELVEAALEHDGRAAVLLRAWLVQPQDTAELAASAFPSIRDPEDMHPWDPSTVWPGGFIASAQVRRRRAAPGRGAFWARTPLSLVRDETVSRLASTAGLLDIANGMTVLADPTQVAFPNIDLTAHLFTTPRTDWVGFDTTVSFGPHGLGVTSSVIHDLHGPIGTLAQALTLRPR